MLLDWKQSQKIVLATIKFTIITHWLSDQKEEKELGPRIEKSADKNEDLQSLNRDKNYDT